MQNQNTSDYLDKIKYAFLAMFKIQSFYLECSFLSKSFEILKCILVSQTFLFFNLTIFIDVKIMLGLLVFKSK